MSKDPVSVREVKHPSCTHRVRYPGPNGTRLQKFFADETEALEFAKKRREELGIVGTAFGGVEEDERAALVFWRAFEARNDPKPPDLLEVLREYAKRYESSRGGATVAAAVDAFLEMKEAEGASAFHLQALKSRLGRFRRDMAERAMASITTSEISDWILNLRGAVAPRNETTKGRPPKQGALSLQTKRNHRLAVHSLFHWAKTRGMVTANPVADAAKPKPPKRLPGILKPTEVKAFFGALTAKAPALVPFWAVRVFAGVREQEAIRLEWSMIDLKTRRINLPAAITKTGKPRTVEIQPALAAFLRPHTRKAGPLAPQTEMTRRYHLAQALKAIRGGLTLPSNWARHTFATMHLHAFRHAGETAIQLGHRGSPELLHAHYAGVATEAEAKAFWTIRPKNLPQPDNVVEAEFGSASDRPQDGTAKPAKVKRKTAR